MIPATDDPRGRYGRDRAAGERIAGGIGAAVIVAGIGAMLTFGLAGARVTPIEQPAELIAISVAPLPPPEPPPPPVEPSRATRARQAPAPPNIRSKATEIVAPRSSRPLPTPIVTASVPAPGMAATSGASDRPGPGTGAGGRGDGLGGGGDGDGGDTPPRQTRGRLSYADMPAALRAAGRGGTVGVSFQVETSGRVDGCEVTRSSGLAELDRVTCARIEQRFRYAPARDAYDRPVRSTVIEEHRWEVDRSGYDRE